MLLYYRSSLSCMCETVQIQQFSYIALFSIVQFYETVNKWAPVKGVGDRERSGVMCSVGAYGIFLMYP